MAWHVGRKYWSVFAWVLAVGAATQARELRVGTSPTTEYSSLRAAVEAAQTGDIIVLSEGRYSTDEYRNLVIRGKAITIRSRDPNDPAVVAATILDCQGSPTRGSRAFEVGPGPGTRLTILGLTIVNGYYNISGGAVLCEEAEFRAYNCTFSGNRVQWWGGALLFRESRASLEGCTFLNNASDASRGGAVFCETTVLTIDDCLFQSNTGGGVESHDSDLMLTRCIFQQNTAQIGGAVHSRTDTDPRKLSRLTLHRCTFAGNAAQTLGGALYLYEVPATIDACTFTANTAGTDGGAILNYRVNPLITNCILAGNKAQGAGGAVMSLFNSNPRILHCTFIANLAGRGGALAARGQGHTLVSHCILWDNTAA
ncbi:MAG TPA: right-handed parallel beta-helix repeat-containing protein, partial [Sedimentisphaerales bacterium]|nr:right-handed parallel beta-helix repeat-containing protein [Sedimentisphaerales bacterium]